MIKACQYCEYSYEHKQKYTGVNVPNEEEFSCRRFPQEIEVQDRLVRGVNGGREAKCMNVQVVVCIYPYLICDLRITE